jgi:hypothetical protein
VKRDVLNKHKSVTPSKRKDLQKRKGGHTQKTFTGKTVVINNPNYDSYAIAVTSVHRKNYLTAELLADANDNI